MCQHCSTPPTLENCADDEKSHDHEDDGHQPDPAIEALRFGDDHDLSAIFLDEGLNDQIVGITAGHALADFLEFALGYVARAGERGAGMIAKGGRIAASGAHAIYALADFGDARGLLREGRGS